MSNPLPHAQRIYELIREHIVEAAHWVQDRLEVIWHRHLEYMSSRDGYRAQVVAGIAALVAVTELDPRLAALLVAVLGLHAAAHGHRAQALRPAPYFDDDRWNPFN